MYTPQARTYICTKVSSKTKLISKQPKHTYAAPAAKTSPVLALLNKEITNKKAPITNRVTRNFHILPDKKLRRMIGTNITNKARNVERARLMTLSRVLEMKTCLSS